MSSSTMASVTDSERRRQTRGVGLAMTSASRALILCAATVLLTSASMPPFAAGDGPRADPALEFLRTNFGLREADINEVEHDQPVTRSLEASDGREVATLGTIRLPVPVDFYVDQLRNVADFKRGDSVLQIGTFSSPARLEDVQSLTLESDDVAALEQCRPKACDVQLSAEAMRRVGQATSASASARTAVINRVMREVLVDMVNAYRQAGDAALMIYVDDNHPVSVAAEFRAMVDAQPAILKRFPTLDRHMRRYPEASPDTNDIIYWSKEKLGPEVVVSVTHLAVSRLAGYQPARFAAASRQIYGSHYFDASLGITIVLEDATRPEGSYLVYVNRSRLDALAGFFGAMKRLIVRSRTRSAMSKTLVQARDLVERRFAAARTQ